MTKLNLQEFWRIFFFWLKTPIFWGFVYRNPLGDLCTEIPWNTGGFRFTNPPLQIPSSKFHLPNSIKLVYKFKCLYSKDTSSCLSLDIFQSKKNMYKIRIFSRWFCPRSPRPSGIWKSPRARRRALGDFQIPSGLRGSGAKSPWKNPNFIYKFRKPKNALKISRGILCNIALHFAKFYLKFQKSF